VSHGSPARSTVYVPDPDTPDGRTGPGTSPEPRLAALVTNPAAWVDGKLPRLPKAKTDGSGQGPTGDGQDDASGDASDASGDGDQTSPQDGRSGGQEDRRAKKTAASKPARGRDAAGEGDSGE
jgi:hypothetical protein